MSLLYRTLLRPALFLQDSEKAHNRLISSLSVTSRSRLLMSFTGNLYGSPELPVNLFGLEFSNPLGIAAGLDKNGEAVPAWQSIGFGFSEIGGVTLHDQLGNPRPRMFRATAEKALVNRMGFNNDGAQTIADRLARWYPAGTRSAPLGVNLGKGRSTELEDAVGDYLTVFKILADQADYFSINVSSPNTPGLRRLQSTELLRPLLQELQRENNERARLMGTAEAPLLVKLSPDISYRQLDQALEIILETKCAGVIATNTSTSRGFPGTENCEKGGISGHPVRLRSTQVINYVYRATEGKLPIIGVGGIDDPVSAGEKIDAGASLVQIYTGLVYKGPFLAKRIAKALTAQSSSWF